MAELTGLPAVAIAALVARREASAAEVVAAHLERIAAVDGAINAVVALDADGALATARVADAAMARGDPPGPLLGVPFTVKDNLSAAGLPMAIGAPERVGVVAETDATAVARLRSAGGILLGKTNCPPYGGGIETDNPVHGRTNNPYDLARTPGGSSGGEAAIVAAGGSACGLGTDSGASVRLPAHFCGLAALKPTAGRVPVTGVIDDEGPIGALSDPRTQVGPLARAVADVALLLRIVAGPDGSDGGVAPVPLGDPAAVRRRRAARRRPGPERPGDADGRNRCRGPRRGRRAARRGRDSRGRGASGRRPRAHARGLALLWRRHARGRPIPGAAPVGRLPRRDARLRRPLRPARVPRLPGAGAATRRDERPGRDRADELHHAGEPRRLARGDRARRHVARGAADRRAARRAAVARRRGAGRRARDRAGTRRLPPAGGGGGPVDRRHRPGADRQPVNCGRTAAAAQRTALCTSVRGRAPLRKLTRALTVWARPRMIGTDARTTVVPAATGSVRTRRPLTNSVTARIDRPVTVTRATREAHSEATATRATRAGERATTPATAAAGAGGAAAAATGAIGATGGTVVVVVGGGGGGGGQLSFL